MFRDITWYYLILLPIVSYYFTLLHVTWCRHIHDITSWCLISEICFINLIGEIQIHACVYIYTSIYVHIYIYIIHIFIYIHIYIHMSPCRVHLIRGIYIYVCPRAEEIGLKIIRTAKISTSFHGSPRKFRTRFHRSPQNFKEVFME